MNKNHLEQLLRTSLWLRLQQEVESENDENLITQVLYYILLKTYI